MQMTFSEFLEALGRIAGKTNIDNIDDVSLFRLIYSMNLLMKNYLLSLKLLKV